MDKDNDILLQQFFSEAAAMEIDDNGFSKRVMHRLPAPRRHRTVRLWTACCVAIAATLFLVFRGWELLLVYTEVAVRTMTTNLVSIQPVAVLHIVVVLLILCIYELIGKSRQLAF